MLLGTDVLVIHHDRRPDGSEQMPETGLTLPAHASALGKVLLAHDDDVRGQVLAGELADLTDATVTDATMLRDQLSDVCRTGLATSIEEAVLGDAAADVPVADQDGRVIAALGVLAAADAFPLPDAILRELRDAARAISRDLGAR